MKYSILHIVTILTLLSCNSAHEDNHTIQTIDPNDIQLNEIVHDTLTTVQIEKIKKIHNIFENVYPVSLEETMTNFKRDVNPDHEINVWMSMSNAFENYLASKKRELNLATQKEVFALLLSRSMMSNEEALLNANLKIISEEEAHKVLGYYTAPPDPLDVRK